AVILFVGASILTFVPIVGCITAAVLPLIGLGAFVLMVIGIVNAASGQYKPLPLIGHFELFK
ncbi:MAG: hypothetical protein ACK4UN_00500, partial [Limisphaerales bacterium]